MSINVNAKKWVDALRSGEFAQARNALAKGDTVDDAAFCCLGVACEIYRRENILPCTWEPIGRELAFKVPGEYSNTGALPEKVRIWLGLGRAEGQYMGGSLVTLNDDREENFDSIADTIESEPDGLFTVPISGLRGVLSQVGSLFQPRDV